MKEDQSTTPLHRANYEAITIETSDGRRLYWPEGNMARLAPAAACQVAARIVRLRELLAKRPDNFEAQLAKLAEPLPFEKELLSGRIEEVHLALEQLGEQPPR